MAVTLDVIAEKPRARDEEGRVIELSRFADVDSLTAGAGLLTSALEASGLPEPGDQHPNNTNLFLEFRYPRYRTQTSARIELIYQWREQVEEEGLTVKVSDRTIMGGSVLTYEPTELDVFGNQIEAVSRATVGGADVFRPVDGVQKYFASGRLVVQFDEPHPFPIDVQKLWVNAVNQTDWLDEPPESWLCSRVDYVLKTDSTSPKTWSWTFEFLFKPWIDTVALGPVSQWRALVVGFDQSTNARISNPSHARGEIVTYKLYEQLDFNIKFQK